MMNLPPDVDQIVFDLKFTGTITYVRRAKTISFIYQGKEITMLTLTDTQQASLGLAIKDSHGHAATVDGVPQWQSSNIDVADLADIAVDGMSANIIAKGPGVCQITVLTDADLGSGVIPLTGFLDVTVTGGQAMVVELVPGAITEQPQP